MTTSTAPTAPAKAGPGRLARLTDRQRWLVLGLVICGLALLATGLSSPGRYTLDNRFELYWAPDRLLERYGSIWDEARGLGLWRWDWRPSAVGPFVLDAIGLDPWLIERVWHALLLTTAGLGMAALFACFRARLGLEHVVAATVYTFSPITAAFLIPSDVFLGYALAPWLLLLFVRGIRNPRSWRSPAAFALLVFLCGNVNYPGYPGLVFALLPAIPIAAYLVWVDRSARIADIGRWFGKAAVLTLVVSAAGLVTTFFGADTLSNDLANSETLEVISSTSSWSESWRGLGFWLLYVTNPRGYSLTNLESYFTSGAAIVATFLLPLLALVSFVLARARERLLFAGIMLLGVAVMVGAHPYDDATPYGRLLRSLFESGGPLASLRNSFKASSTLAIGIAALLGIGCVELMGAVRRRRPKAAIAVPIAAGIIVLAAAVPYWTGDLYSPTRQMRDLPTYWDRALGWLDEQPGDSRALVLPSSVLTDYTWGSPGDDIFDALLERPHVARAVFTRLQGTSESGNLVDALDDYVASGSYRAGSLAPIARRLGIRHVVVRNDLDWRPTNRPSPSTMEKLRRDPDLRLVRTFGAPGENVSFEGDFPLPTPPPPVQVYEVAGPVHPNRVDARPPVLVSGDGAAWPTLAAAGVLDRAGPVRYTGDLSAEQLADQLERGSELVISDTNRRRPYAAPKDYFPASHGPTLTPDQDDTLLDPLFDEPSTQTVATLSGARRASASTTGSTIGRLSPFWRAANAFDGDPTTAWETGGLSEDPTGEWVQLDFDRRQRISRVRVVPAHVGKRTITRASVELSDGTAVPFEVGEDPVVVHVPPRPTKSLRITIDEVEGGGFEPVGFADISIPGVDTREVIRVPDDVTRQARTSRRLRRALTEAPVSYQFTTLSPILFEEVEPVMRREFVTVGARTFELRGALADPGPAIEESANAELLGADGECRDALTIDDQPIAVRVDRAASPGRPATVVACAPIELAHGRHELETDADVRFEWLTLASGDVGEASGESARVITSESASTTVDGRVRAPKGSSLVVGRSYDPGWSAQIEDRDLGEPVALDTQNGWTVDRDRSGALHVGLGAQKIYVVSLIVTGIGVLVCAVLLIWPGRRRRETISEEGAS